LNLLIDTGANQSFLSPEAVEIFFSQYPLTYDPFEVTNVHATSKNDYSITIRCFKEFNDQDDIKLFVYKFHNHFDGLIGLDLLTKWEAKIDLKTQTLTTKYAANPIKMYNSRNVNLYEDIIPARSSKLAQIPINAPNGEILVYGQFICNCIIHECITTVKNNRGIVDIENPTDNDVIFSLDHQAQAELFNVECMTMGQNPTRVKEVLSKLRTDHLNPEEKENLTRLCSQYSDVFYIEGEPLTFTNKVKHCVKTTDDTPIYTKSYRYPFIHREEVRNQITKMLEQNIIRPSESAWSSPIWVVPKKMDASGKQKWRLVVDFRKLNEKTINDKYPIPNIADVLDKLGKCQYFTTLDLASGFYQVEMNTEDIPKTAFNVEHGHFEFLRMPMGLKNSPSTFQRVMDNVLRGLQNVICLVYLDDIIVFSTSLQEHIVNLEKVFQRLRESNFKIQMDKSEFLKLETAYLGHVISSEGIKPNPDKVVAIQNYPIPQTTKQIKQFLGLLGYYRKFIPDFARITKPMTTCLKKGKKIILDRDYVDCFERCKTLLTNDPILQYPDFNREFILTTDASNVAIGAILSQGTVGSDKPIAFASRTLNDSELNYSTIEKELLAIVWATKYFRPYIYGRLFKIITDHKPLTWLINVKEPNSRLTRWRLKLSEYTYDVVYKKGKANTNADALSRIELHNEQTDTTDHTDEPTNQQGERIMTDEEMNEFVKELLTKPTTEEDCSSLTANPTERPPTLAGSSTMTVHTDSENPILEIPITDEPLNKFHRQLCLTIVGDCKKRPTVTKPFETHIRTSVQLSESNLEEDVINAVKEYVNPKVKTALLITPPLGMYKIVPILQNKFRNSAMNLVLAKTEIENVKEYLRQQDIIRHYHEGKTNHRGINECYLSLSHKYYWPKMKDQVTKFINECITCGQAKYDRHPIRQKFNLVIPATKPFEVIHMDLFTAQSEKYITFVDVFSKYGQAYHLRDGTAISIIQALLKYSSHHRLPLAIVTDNGTEFTNQLFAEFLRLHRISHHRTLAHSPNDNGIIERFHSTLLEHLRILRLTRKDEPVFNLMPYAIIAYNSSIHGFTKCRPYDILTGHFDPRDPVDINLNEQLLQQYILNHREQMQLVYDIINKSASADRAAIIENRNKSREPEEEYQPQQQVFIKNPAADRQKIAPRYTQDKVLADLPIHIYTSKKRGPVAKSRLKRVPKSAKLLQDAPVNSDSTRLSSPGDKT
jgi:hypothetical protein